MSLPLDLWLVHPEDEMCEAFEVHFKGLPNVRVVKSRYEDLDPHDCFVTAGNCYGIMTAGIDAAVVAFHGEELMQRIQHHILDEFLGEQPVGTCFIQSTGNPDYPFIAHSPTMRVPGSIAGSDKVYLATWAARCFGKYDVPRHYQRRDAADPAGVGLEARHRLFSGLQSRARRSRQSRLFSKRDS